MRQPTYDELYGVNLDEYYEYLDKNANWEEGASTVIPQIVEAEIEMLEANYKKYAQRNHLLDDHELWLAGRIANLRNKKKKHLKRLLQWKHGVKSKKNLKHSELTFLQKIMNRIKSFFLNMGMEKNRCKKYMFSQRITRILR